MEKIFHSHERIAVFIDGSNLYGSSVAANFKIDFKKLKDYFSSQGNLIRAFYFTALRDDAEFSKLRPLVDYLDFNGYTCITKNTKEFKKSDGTFLIKGNMDVEIAVEILEFSPYIDHIVLFSGDGDFRYVVEAVQKKGKKVTVASAYKCTGSSISEELRRQADFFLDIALMQEEFFMDNIQKTDE